MSSEDTTRQRLPDERALLDAIEAALCGGGEEQFDIHVTHADVAAAAVEGVRAWLVGRAVVDLSEPDEFDLRELPAVVRDMRRERGLSLRDLAAVTGTSINTLSKFERGGDIKLSTAVKLIGWLSVPGSSGEARHG